jgi:hypothetical protein
MNIALDESGYGRHVGTSVKKEFFLKDLNALLDAYNVRLARHPFDDHQQDLYIIQKDLGFNTGDQERVNLVISAG